MENNTTTEKFVTLNFNLKKIIFSFLDRHVQSKIFWLNKKLRPLLPDSPLMINIDKLRKISSYELEGGIYGILEFTQSMISCFSTKGMKLLNLYNNSLELTKSLPLDFSYYTFAIEQENEVIIYRSGPFELTSCDKDFNLISKYKDTLWICSLYKISKLSFAIGLRNGTIKVFSANSKNKNYDVVKQCKYHSDDVNCLLYLPKYDYLLSGSSDKTINIITLSEGKLIKRLIGHSYAVYSLISLNDETFASSSKGEIKILSIKEDTSIECIKTIYTHEETINSIYLYNLGNEFMVSKSNKEFKIWDVRTYECMKTYKEDSVIYNLIVIKDNNIITGTGNKKVNLWKIKLF
jgi:WD40 repeat protein